MSDLIHKLGIDWKLLSSQAVNFLILLFVLRKFAYKPLLKILEKRRGGIEEGLAKATEADRRLKEANEAKKEKIKEGERESLEMLRRTEEQARETESKLLDAAHRKEAEVLKNAEVVALARQKEAEGRLREEAVALVKAAIVKTVELDPEAVDEKLIKKSLEHV